MMKRTIALCLASLMVFCASSASAQTVSCPSGGFTLTLPDRFVAMAPSQPEEPDLVLRYSDGSVDLTTYVSFTGASNDFQILNGDELEYGPVVINGMEMFRVRGADVQGPWISYSWLWAGRSVCIYFIWSGDENAALAVIQEIMYSIAFG